MAQKPRSNIILYPLLTDTGLSTSTIVLTAKAVERFILIYDVESVITSSKRSGVAYQLRGRNLYLKEGTEYIQEVDPNKRGDPGTTDVNLPALPDPELEKRRKEEAERKKEEEKKRKEEEEKKRKEEEEKKKKEKSTIRYTPDTKTDMVSISAEPTYTTVMSSEKQAVFLGVKAFPVPVTSSKDLVAALVDDTNRRFIEYLLVKLGRIFQRRMWKVLNRLLPFTRRQISGQSRDSIIIPRTKYERVFCLINYINLDKDIFRSPSIISQLFSLGWDSIIVADEVQKTLYFCMKEFGGMCSIIPYSILQTTIGKGQKDAFDSLEDIRSSSAPLFRLKKKSTTIGESIINSEHKKLRENKMSSTLLDSYLPLLEIEYNLSSKFNQSTMLKTIDDLKDGFEKVDFQKLINLSKKIKVSESTNTQKIISYFQKKNPDFNKAFELSKRVLSNSYPNVDNRSLDGAALLIAIAGTFKKETNAISGTKDALKEFSRMYDRKESQIKRHKIIPDIHGDEMVAIAIIIVAAIILLKVMVFLPQFIGLGGLVAIGFVLRIVGSMLQKEKKK
jgi:hypothetical protein